MMISFLIQEPKKRIFNFELLQLPLSIESHLNWDLKTNVVGFSRLTLSVLWDTGPFDDSSIYFLDFKSITGANIGVEDKRDLFDVVKLEDKLDFGGPIFGFLTCNCDCIIFAPVDQPTATSVGGAPRSSSSYRDMF